MQLLGSAAVAQLVIQKLLFAEVSSSIRCLIFCDVGVLRLAVEGSLVVTYAFLLMLSHWLLGPAGFRAWISYLPFLWHQPPDLGSFALYLVIR